MTTNKETQYDSYIPNLYKLLEKDESLKTKKIKNKLQKTPKTIQSDLYDTVENILYGDNNHGFDKEEVIIASCYTLLETYKKAIKEKKYYIHFALNLNNLIYTKDKKVKISNPQAYRYSKTPYNFELLKSFHRLLDISYKDSIEKVSNYLNEEDIKKINKGNMYPKNSEHCPGNAKFLKSRPAPRAMKMKIKIDKSKQLVEKSCKHWFTKKDYFEHSTANIGWWENLEVYAEYQKKFNIQETIPVIDINKNEKKFSMPYYEPSLLYPQCNKDGTRYRGLQLIFNEINSTFIDKLIINTIHTCIKILEFNFKSHRHLISSKYYYTPYLNHTDFTLCNLFCANKNHKIILIDPESWKLSLIPMTKQIENLILQMLFFHFPEFLKSHTPWIDLCTNYMNMSSDWYASFR